MATKQKDDLLRKIAGLMAKAESTEHEGERQVFMEKADELMMKYSIELWELAKANESKLGLGSRQPIVRDFDYHWAFDSGPFPEINEALWAMFCSVASFATCKIVYHKQHFSGEAKKYKGYTVPVIGTESDLGYLTLLFTSLMTQLLEATHPKVDKSASYIENLCKFREAGWGWDETAKVMVEAGFNTDLPTFARQRDKMIRDYRSWCKATGTPQNYAHFKTYRRNFADGFANRVAGRLREMRQHSAESLGTGMEIALRDQGQINMEFMMNEFPVDGRQRQTALTKDNRKFDSAAYTGGRAAGDRANISVNPGKGLSGKKELKR